MAQKEIVLEFENGEKKIFTMDYDDPEVLSKWNVNARFFGLLAFSSEGLSFRLNPVYRVNYNWVLEASYAMPYAKSLDGNATEGAVPKRGAKVSRDWSIMSHYIVFSNSKIKLKKLAVDFKQEGNVQTVYSAMMPRMKKRNLSLDGGLGNYRYFSGGGLVSLKNPDPNSDTSYSMGNISYLSLNAGASLFKSESYKMTTDGVSRTYWRYSRLYAYMSIGVRPNYEVNRVIQRTSGGFLIDPAVQHVSDGYVKPETIPLGYRIGYEKNWGIKNSGSSLSFGIEFGDMPRFKIDQTAKAIFMFHVGFGFGPKPAKL